LQHDALSQDPGARERARVGLRELQERVKRAERRAAFRAVLEQVPNTNTERHDQTLADAISSVLCGQELAQGSAALDPTSSVSHIIDRSMATAATPARDPARTVELDPAALEAYLTAAAKSPVTRTQLALDVSCLSSMAQQVAQSLTQRLEANDTPDEELEEVISVTGAALKLAPSAQARGFRAVALRSLAGRSLQRGDRAAALRQLRAALADLPRTDGNLRERTRVVLQLAPLRPAELGATLQELEQSVKAELARSRSPQGQVPALGASALLSQLEQLGVSKSAALRNRQAAELSTALAIAEQSARAVAPLLEFSQLEARVVLPLGLARAYDLSGRASSADRVRREAEQALGAELETASLMAVTWGAISHADLGDRANASERRDLAAVEREYGLAAGYWERALRTWQLIRLDAAFPTSRSPLSVFEQAIQAAIQAGHAESALHWAMRVQALSEPLRPAAAPGAPSVQALNAKLSALEQRALQATAEPARKALAAGIKAAHGSQRQLTTLVSPLATAGLRLDALVGYLPSAELAPLSLELAAFEDAYQASRSRATSQRDARKAEGKLSAAENTRRQSAGQDAADHRARTRAEDELARMLASGEVSSLTFRRTASPATLAKALPTDTTLVSYFIGESESAAFVTSTAGTTAVPLSETRRGLEPVVERAASGDSPALASLYRALVAPLATQLKTKRLVVVPHGVLSLVPFEALYDGKQYLFQRFAVSRASHAVDLVGQTSAARKPAASGLAAAAPEVAGLPKLPGATAELAGVQAALPRTVTLARDLSEAQLRARLPQLQHLHLIAHTELVPSAPMFTRLLLGAGGGGDGSFEAREIASLNLPNLELVVLSACDSATGRSAGRHGSLAHAFLAAGARSIVASLWPVSDAASAELMRHFYARVAAGDPIDRALGSARQALLDQSQFAHPREWAPFVLLGDRAPLSFFKP
jgi:CHAT domain-containing protein